MRLDARILAIASLAGSLLAGGHAHARLFRQTYGATVPTADGCAWNINQDYFVPRHCDSCRYGLYSPCKTAHSLSPACRHLHPLYCGYCTPYGACRYRWRDHIYKKYCGCTPLACTYGPWKLDRCRKHAGCQGTNCGAETCGGACPAGGPCNNAWPADAAEFAGYGAYAEVAELPNIESMEMETLGAIDALGPAAAAGGNAMGAMGAMGLMSRPAGAMNLPSASPAPPLPALPAGIVPAGTANPMSVPMPSFN
jgi:hypothetical protein